MLDLAEFAPDRSKYDPAASEVLTNFVPRLGGHGPFPAFVPFTVPVPARPIGWLLANLSQGDYELFVGTQTRLYRLNPTTLVWSDVSKESSPGVKVNYASPAGRDWDFQQYGNLILATNGVDPIQSYNLSAPDNFSDLSSDAPTAFNINVIGDFVFATNTSDGEGAARWSGLNNPTFWTLGQQSSDFQVFPDGSEIQAVASFDAGAVIFHEDCIREARLALDSPLIMSFSKTVENHGALSKRSVVSTGAGVFYLSQDGFYRYGAPPAAIGAERVNRFFMDDAAVDRVRETQAVEDPFRSVIYWAYASNSNPSSTTFDKAICYHYALDKWSVIEPGTMMAGFIEAVTPGYTLDSIDDAFGYNLDTLPFSLDSRIFTSSAPTLAGFDAQRRMGFFTGAPMAAKGRTARMPLAQGRRAFVSGFRPVGDAPELVGRVAAMATAGSPPEWGGEANMNRTGLVPARRDGRFHQFEISIPADADWTVFHGIEPDVRAAGLQ